MDDDGLTPELCDTEIIPILDEHSAELNCALVATLTWWSASGVEVGGQKVIRRSNVNVAESDRLSSTGGQLTGDYTSQAAQAQKHLEVMAQMFLKNMNQMFTLQRQAQEHTMELCDRLAARVVDSERQAEKAKQEAAEAQEVIAQVQENDGSDSDVSASQAQMMQQLAPYFPMIAAGVMKALMGGSLPLPPTAPTPPPTVE